jgi:hypothetical protein
LGRRDAVSQVFRSTSKRDRLVGPLGASLDDKIVLPEHTAGVAPDQIGAPTTLQTLDGDASCASSGRRCL